MIHDIDLVLAFVGETPDARRRGRRRRADRERGHRERAARVPVGRRGQPHREPRLAGEAAQDPLLRRARLLHARLPQREGRVAVRRPGRAGARGARSTRCTRRTPRAPAPAPRAGARPTGRRCSTAARWTAPAGMPLTLELEAFAAAIAAGPAGDPDVAARPPGRGGPGTLGLARGEDGRAALAVAEQVRDAMRCAGGRLVGGARAAAMTAPGRIVLVAGEPSGDRHGALPGAALQATPEPRRTDASRASPGRPCAPPGVRPLARMEDVAVVGFAEILGHLPGAPRRAPRHRPRALAAPGTRLFLPVDFPGFNLPLPRRAHRHGVPVLHYVAPAGLGVGQRPARGHAPRRRPARRDPALRGGAGSATAAWPATYVGHPLVEALEPTRDRAAFAREAGLDRGRRRSSRCCPAAATRRSPGTPSPLLGALAAPAPRRGPAARARRRRRPRRRTGRGSRRRSRRTSVRACASSHEGTREALRIRAAPRSSPRERPRSSAARWARRWSSSTACRGVSHAIARRVVRLPRFGLVNIVAGEDVAPELLQAEVTPERILAALLPLWDDGAGARRGAREAAARARPPGHAGRQRAGRRARRRRWSRSAREREPCGLPRR